MQSEPPATEGLEASKRGRVLILRLSRPEVHNAFSRAVVEGILGWLAWVDAGADVGAVVVTGTDPSFCSGADTSDMAAGQLDLTGRPSLPDALRSCSVPTICAINGPGYGGGATVPLAADLRIASPRASLSFHFVGAGLSPEGGSTYTLPRLVGRGAALDILLAARTVDAKESLRLGLVDRVVAEHENLLPEAVAWAAELASVPKDLACQVKELLSTSDTISFAMQRKLERRAFAETVTARIGGGGSLASASPQ